MAEGEDSVLTLPSHGNYPIHMAISYPRVSMQGTL